MAGDLGGAWEKLHRAREHRQALTDEIREIIPYDPRYSRLGAYTIRMECEREGNEYTFYADEGPGLDTTRCALIVGDALFNLRSALDHIVFQLHVRHYKGNIPAGIEKLSAFPICKTRRKKDTSQWSEIGRLSQRHRRAIEFLQPYNTRNDKYRWVRLALHDINALNVIDKHRRLHVIRTAVTSFAVPNLGPGGTHRVFFGPLIGKTKIMRWTFETVPHDIASKIKQYGHATIQIWLDEPGIGGEPVVLLEAFINNVDEAIRRFELFFR